jgi:hypothetical protein
MLKRSCSQVNNENNDYFIAECLNGWLLNKLPDPTKPWTLEGRKKWLQLASGILDVMYTGADESKTLTITVEDDNYSAK